MKSENFTMIPNDPHRDVEAGMYNGDTTFCPVNAYSDCSYCDQCNVCHMPNPFVCEDWKWFWSSWDEWQNADTITDERTDFAQEEINWAKETYGYEPDNLDLGFDPFVGAYTDDC